IIGNLPQAGSLLLNGVAMISGQSVAVADIAAGLLQLAPAANANGNAYANFTFQVQDDGGVANGGINTDQVAKTMTLDVTSVNDAPLGTSTTVTTLEDTPYVFQLTDFGYSDAIDAGSTAGADNFANVIIGNTPLAGSLTLNGVAVAAGQSVSVTDIAAGLLQLAPVANANGTSYANFTFQVQDDGGTANGGINTDQTARTMTLDVTSVNDAPALKRADIGVAMGMKGTEVAKEAAEMVLADDNFATIVHAVEEGRTVYDNIKKAIAFLIPTNGGEAGIILFAILFGMTLPITPVQILWVNMVTAVTLALALSFEKSEPGVMQRPPRVADEAILSGFMIWRIIFVSLLLAGGSITLFLWEGARGMSIEASRSVAVNTLVVGEMAYLLNCRYLFVPVRTWQDFTGNSYILLSIVVLAVIQAIFTYLPFMQQMFGVAAIDASAWGRIIGFGVLLFVVVEVEKTLIRKNRNK
ncbi:MAG: cation transporting ATPase C-terminal domain-containing protein, partial [Novosphingobium sp.]|uniref:cation transporting ATPase C-terminal domain-containing protein n=1 Tax=Novosphingobium sp. TaxID=1874826 RepID=UPI003C7D707F